MEVQRLGLAVLPERLAIHRLDAADPIPAWASNGHGFVSITRTREELSVVCAETAAPDGVARQAGWRCLQVLGPLDLSLVGVLASMIEPLAAAQLSVFAVSTYDTDYLLVRDDALDQVVATLRAAGHVVHEKGA
jgi:hypothetical protein